MNTKIGDNQRIHSAKLPDKSFFERYGNSKLEEEQPTLLQQSEQSKESQQPEQHLQQLQQQPKNQPHKTLLQRSQQLQLNENLDSNQRLTKFNNVLPNENNDSKENTINKSTQTDEKHELIDSASTSRKRSTVKSKSKDEEKTPKLNVEKQITDLTTEFQAANVIPNPTVLAVKEGRYDNDSPNLLHKVFLQDTVKKRSSIVKRESSRLSAASSTISTISSVIGCGCDAEILNRFLYSDLMNYKKSFVSIYSSSSDCSSITQRLGLSNETIWPHIPRSVIAEVTDLQEKTEAHFKMLAQPQHFVGLLDIDEHGNNLREADISETSLVHERGAIYIAGCKLSFPEGSFQSAVNVKLSCLFQLQVSKYVIFYLQY